MVKLEKKHLRPRVVVGNGIKIFVPRPLHYVTRSPGVEAMADTVVAFVLIS